MAKILAKSTEAFADIRMTSDNGFILASCPTWNFRIQNTASKETVITVISNWMQT
jgi:hypothetical protein